MTWLVTSPILHFVRDLLNMSTVILQVQIDRNAATLESRLMNALGMVAVGPHWMAIIGVSIQRTLLNVKALVTQHGITSALTIHWSTSEPVHGVLTLPSVPTLVSVVRIRRVVSIVALLLVSKKRPNGHRKIQIAL